MRGSLFMSFNSLDVNIFNEQASCIIKLFCGYNEDYDREIRNHSNSIIVPELLH